MLRKTLRGLLVLVLLLSATGGILFVTNAPPAVAPIAAAALTNSQKPFVIKLHAQWCPVCMVTKGEWREIESAYADRAHLVVFDSTTAAAVERSRAEAERLGLGDFLDRYHGATGMVVVVDGRTGSILAELGGRRSFAEYSDAIDSALGAL
jgi:hypothetical protein